MYEIPEAGEDIGVKAKIRKNEKNLLTKGFIFAIISSTPLERGGHKRRSVVSTKENEKVFKKGVDKDC